MDQVYMDETDDEETCLVNIQDKRCGANIAYGSRNQNIPHCAGERTHENDVKVVLCI